MDNPINSDDPNRLPDGTFAPGNNANPAGGARKGWTPYKLRCQLLLEKYTTEELLAFARNDAELAKLSSIDAVAVVHLARSIDAKLSMTESGSSDIRGERKELLDRIEGQSRASLELTGPNGGAVKIESTSPTEASKEYQKMMGG